MIIYIIRPEIGKRDMFLIEFWIITYHGKDNNCTEYFYRLIGVKIKTKRIGLHTTTLQNSRDQTKLEDSLKFQQK